MKRLWLCLGLVPIVLVACTPKSGPSPDPVPSAAPSVAPTQTAAPTVATTPPSTTAVAPVATGPDPAGKPAPDFSLQDLDGKSVRLADYKGKVVVLEWFNPRCPFVKLAHTSGLLKDMAAKEIAKGVVWLGVNSAASGKQGSGKEENKKGADIFGIPHPILLDEDGKVGRAYGATNTPHLFVIDAKGTLVYGGAIDDTLGGEVEKDQKVVNYVALALEAAKAGKLPQTTKTKAWGCSVKYANP